MTPVDQLQIHDPDNGVIGDCFRACLASLLDMKPDEVPHVMSMYEDGEWIRIVNGWLADFDLCFMEFTIPDADVFEQWRAGFEKCGVSIFHTLCGPSPRFAGLKHSVVARNGVIVHDPHPDRSGLAGTPDLIGFLWSRNAMPRFRVTVGAGASTFAVPVGVISGSEMRPEAAHLGGGGSGVGGEG